MRTSVDGSVTLEGLSDREVAAVSRLAVGNGLSVSQKTVGASSTMVVNLGDGKVEDALGLLVLLRAAVEDKTPNDVVGQIPSCFTLRGLPLDAHLDG